MKDPISYAQELKGDDLFLADITVKAKNCKVIDQGQKKPEILENFDHPFGDPCYRYSENAENEFFANVDLAFAMLVYFYSKGRELPD